MTSILFVCLGNICRSPTAEAVARARARHLTFDSAGTAGWHSGKPPYPQMQVAASARSIAMADLRARQVTASEFARFDLILAMDQANLADLEEFRPPGNRTETRLFADYGPGGDIPDPYYTRDFDGCLYLIETCTEALLTALSGRTPPPSR